jgi:putative transcriptional regulator
MNSQKSGIHGWIIYDQEPTMLYKPLTVNHQNLTIMGVPFASSHDFDAAANALGTVMFEGYEPKPRGIEIIRDYVSGKITLEQLVHLTKRKEYA